jgi:tRNA-modifying protein YgfZ
MLSVDEGYQALRTGSTAVVVPRDVIEVVGPQAEAFLQGQLSQDVAGLAVGASTPAFLLDPTGKLGFWLRVTRVSAERFLLDLDAGYGADAVARLSRFKLRTKADITVLDWHCTVLGRANASATDPSDRIGTAEPAATEPAGTEPAASEPAGTTGAAGAMDPGGASGPAGGADPAGSVRTVAAWPGATGTDLLAPAGAGTGTADDNADPGLVPIGAVEAVRIEAGVPALGAELVPGQTIPAEAGQWVIDASVSFTKGCFTGQELVARIDSRGGNVPRQLRGLVIDATPDDLPAAGDEVVVADQVVASLTSVAWSPGFGAAVALAMIPRSVEVPTAALVRTATGDRPARLATLPLVD